MAGEGECRGVADTSYEGQHCCAESESVGAKDREGWGHSGPNTYWGLSAVLSAGFNLGAKDALSRLSFHKDPSVL